MGFANLLKINQQSILYWYTKLNWIPLLDEKIINYLYNKKGRKMCVRKYTLKKRELNFTI